MSEPPPPHSFMAAGYVVLRVSFMRATTHVPSLQSLRHKPPPSSSARRRFLHAQTPCIQHHCLSAKAFSASWNQLRTDNCPLQAYFLQGQRGSSRAPSPPRSRPRQRSRQYATVELRKPPVRRGDGSEALSAALSMILPWQGADGRIISLKGVQRYQ